MKIWPFDYVVEAPNGQYISSANKEQEIPIDLSHDRRTWTGRYGIVGFAEGRVLTGRSTRLRTATRPATGELLRSATEGTPT